MTWRGERVNGVMGERVNGVTGTLLEQSGEDTHDVHDVQAHLHYYKHVREVRWSDKLCLLFAHQLRLRPQEAGLEMTSCATCQI